MSIDDEHRSGFVALAGRSNVGKSTLVNQLAGKKVAITSPVAQTTRNRLRAILTTPSSQIVLIDTPGIHKPHHLLGERLVQSTRSAISEVDLVLLLFDGSTAPGRGDVFMVNLLRCQPLPILATINKWDCLNAESARTSLMAYRELLNGLDWPLLRCSALKGDGCEELLTVISSCLPRGPQLYPPEMVSDQPERLLLAEIIREQVLLHTRDEVPHSVAVNVDRIENVQRDHKHLSYTAMLATVFVECQSQKRILIGKDGTMLRTIGRGARLQIQNLINSSVYLELFVKVAPDWRSKPARLKELGY
ncbi:GTPase Era [cyanobiont of Ornithocercus magnificus]|nr:GTPase Era [cyanobiont of Ornithocercus magnificus]